MKVESDVACLTEKGREFQVTGPIYRKDLSPRALLYTLGTRKIRVEVKQLGEVWRSCTRDNVEAGGSYFVLNPAADEQPMEIEE